MEKEKKQPGFEARPRRTADRSEPVQTGVDKERTPEIKLEPAVYAELVGAALLHDKVKSMTPEEAVIKSFKKRLEDSRYVMSMTNNMPLPHFYGLVKEAMQTPLAVADFITATSILSWMGLRMLLGRDLSVPEPIGLLFLQTNDPNQLYSSLRNAISSVYQLMERNAPLTDVLRSIYIQVSQKDFVKKAGFSIERTLDPEVARALSLQQTKVAPQLSTMRQLNVDNFLRK